MLGATMPDLEIVTMSLKRIIRSYSALIELPTFEERFEYLKLSSKIGDATFGYERYLNQIFYASPEWKAFRREVIIRDGGLDLAMEGYDILTRIEIHHINPITPEDIETNSSLLMDMDNVVCTSSRTHKAIHYGDASLLPKDPVIRRPNDMCPWKV